MLSNEVPPSNMSSQHIQHSFAQSTKRTIQPLTEFKHPSSNQGILFPFIQDSKIVDYLTAVNEILADPKKIIAASRISNNRVAIFLANESLIELVLTSGIKICSQLIHGRRMANKPTKLIERIAYHLQLNTREIPIC